MKVKIRNLFFLWCLLVAFYFVINHFFSFTISFKYVIFSFFCGYLFFIFSVFLFLRVNSFLDSKKISETEISFLGFIFSILFGIVFFFFVLKFSLYANAIIGNDLFLSLDVKEDFFSLKNGESFVIDSSYSVLNNPFCVAECNLAVKDLYSGETLYLENEILALPKKNHKKFNISISEERYGQKIYRLEFFCFSRENFLCHVNRDDEKFVSRAIVLEHFLNEEQARYFSDLNRSLYDLNVEYTGFIRDLGSFKNFTDNCSSLDLSSYSQKISSLYRVVLNENLTYENTLFSRQNFSGLEDSLNRKYKKFDEIGFEIRGLNKSIKSDIEAYNDLLDTLSHIYSELEYFSFYGVDFSSINNLNNFIGEYNKSVLKFFECGNLSDKVDIVFDLVSYSENISLTLNENYSYFPSDSLPQFYFEEIDFPSFFENVSFNMESPPMSCCSFGKCDPCSSSNSSSNYPVLFVHGHGFNKEISVYSSLASMGNFQRELEKEGYFNAGNFISYNEDSLGALEKMNFPFSFSISYYVPLQGKEGFDLVPELSNIENYSYRLNDYIEGIKKITGKEKVILVSYSMGGLVSRKYLQIFGEDSVDRLIMVSVPNSGVEGIVDSSCSVFGASKECNDLSVGSDFLENLNSGRIPSLKVYNLIGEGCSIVGASGDGIVESKRAYVPFAINRYFFGSCDGVYFLHEKVLDPSIVPEAFNLIKRFIKE